MKGKWIIIYPTDGFTMVPVYQCSVCKKSCSGYEPGPICPYCESNNKVDAKKFTSKSIKEIFEDE